jgi:hypothetical protein
MYFIWNAVAKTGLSFHLEMEPTQLDSTDRASLSPETETEARIRNVVLNKI